MKNINHIKYLRSFSLNYCSSNLTFFKNLLQNFSLKLFLLDEISRKLCYFTDNLSLMNLMMKNTEKNKEISKEIENSFGFIDEYMHKLNSDEVLYNQLLYMKYHENSQFFNEYECDFLKNMIKDYEEKYGILMQKKEAIEQILNEEHYYKGKFEKNLNENEEKLEFSSKNLEIFKKIGFEETKFNEHFNGKNISILLYYKEILLLMKKVKDDELKEILLKKYLDSNEQNIPILSLLLKTRSLYTNLINPEETYAEFSLRNNSMIGNYLNISNLIMLLSKEAVIIQRRISEEIKENCSLSALFEKTFEENNSIFSLKNAIQFISQFFENYALIKVLWSFSSEEIFANEIKTIRFEIKSIEGNSSLGTIILPLSGFNSTQTMVISANCKANFYEKIRIKPKFYLIFDFFKIKKEEISLKNEEISVNFGQMKNIVHEFAHALHNILSYHDFQYISNNTRLDYAEFIAIFFENLFCKHFPTGKHNENSKKLVANTQKFNEKTEKIDKNTLKKLVEKLEQIYFSLLDLRIHNEKDFFHKSSSEISKIINRINSETFLEVFGEFDKNHHMIPNHYYCSMLHLTNYPSIYYSYSIGFIFFEEFSLKEEENSMKFRRNLNKFLAFGHKKDIFYLILKEIF